MTLTESDLSARLGEIYTAALGVFKEEGTLTFPAVARHSRTEPEDLARRWACPADLLIEALVDGIFPIPADPGDRGLQIGRAHV